MNRINKIDVLAKSSLVLFFTFSVPNISHAGQCIAIDTHISESVQNNPSELPKLALSDFNYVGAFTLADKAFGESGPSYSHGLIQYHDNSMFITGFAPHDAIAEYPIPTLVNSTVLSEIVAVDTVVQGFSKIIPRAEAGNPDNLDSITGMGIVDGKLVVNIAEYYDADGGALDTTLVIENPNDLSGSAVRGFLRLPGAARSGGWISPVPPEWQAEIGSTHIVGNSSNLPIFSRHSIGPSAHALNTVSLANATISQPDISTTKLMEFSHAEPIHPDFEGVDPDNDLWNILAGAWYGFIVPGTSTYATFGGINGMESGIGYKITQSDGNRCDGFCSYTAGDSDPYYWFFDVNDLLEVKAGLRSASSIRPYDYGVLPVPFQPQVGSYAPSGGTFDEDSGTLYLSLAQANSGRYHRIPVIVAYKFN